jgi:hypothetical protein
MVVLKKDLGGVKKRKHQHASFDNLVLEKLNKVSKAFLISDSVTAFISTKSRLIRTTVKSTSNVI